LLNIVLAFCGERYGMNVTVIVRHAPCAVAVAVTVAVTVKEKPGENEGRAEVNPGSFPGSWQSHDGFIAQEG
ncbi:MAG TPA: hypothetical protein PK140_19225, partial [Polyangiaceae bacterium]|nr:hypothetical protein [Polyangiaceae bacterium]